MVNTTFGGAEGYGNAGANGGGISNIGGLWHVLPGISMHDDTKRVILNSTLK